MIAKKGVSSGFLVSLFVLLLVLFVRVTRGLDLSDEMQYYGEIKGLLESGKLFSNDLFFQQSVYVLFYPAFYIYHLVFGFEGLVFFGRLLMSTLTIVVFFFAYNKLVSLKFSRWAAGITALSLSFAIPFHGVFALSYNTVSQVVWIIFALKYFEWKRGGEISFAIVTIVIAFAHPTSALVMSALIIGRYAVEKQFKAIGKVLLVFLGGIFVALTVVLYFASLQDYFDSLSFSSGYGVGETFFSNTYQQVVLVGIYLLFGLLSIIWRRIQWLNYPMTAMLLLVMAIISSVTGLLNGAYAIRVVYVLSVLSAFAYAWSLSNTKTDDGEYRSKIQWLVVLLLTYLTTLGITSGNGIGQSTGAFMVGLPILLGLAVTLAREKQGNENFTIPHVGGVVLVCILFVVNWSIYPYRESSWWHANKSIDSVREYKFINSTEERVEFITGMQKLLGPNVHSKRTLLVSEYPALYSILDTKTETCMLYMHSLTSDKSEDILLDCLSKKSPEIIVDILSNRSIAKRDSRIKVTLKSYYQQLGFQCVTKSIDVLTGRDSNEHLDISICQKGV